MPDYQYQTDDLPIEPPEESGDYEQVPTGAYMGTLKAFRQQDTPPWKMASQSRFHPEREPDAKQFEWTFHLTELDQTISDWTSRSWHTRSKASSYACALLDVPVLPRGQGFTTGQLVGRPCQVWVVEKEKDDGTTRSYVDKVLPVPKRRAAAAQAPVQESTPGPLEAPSAPNAAPQVSYGPHAFVSASRTGKCDVCGEGAASLIHASQSRHDEPDGGPASEDLWNQLAADNAR